MNQNEQNAAKMVELERKVRAQAQLIDAMEGTAAGLRSQLAGYKNAIKTLESEREANRILTRELEQAKLATKYSLATQPAPVVRLTFEEAIAIFRRPGIQEWGVANAIMDAFLKKNGVDK